MHLQFGNLAKIRRIVYFRLSPYEQKPFAGMISNGFPNLLRRIQEQSLRILPPMIFTYFLIDWADKKNLELSRKNPKDYEDEV